MSETKLKNSQKYILIFLIVSIVLLSISIIYPFIVNYFFNNWTTSGTFGDSYGALNAIFSGLAFSGVITTILIQKKELANQREEMRLQRIEMKETRREFLINRCSNIVYNQLDRFEKSLSLFKMSSLDGNTVTSGDEAIEYLLNQKTLNWSFLENEGKYEINGDTCRLKQLEVYAKNGVAIGILADNLYKSVRVLQSLIFQTDLEIEELNKFKGLFFNNIGPRFLAIIHEIIAVHDYRPYDKKKDKEKIYIEFQNKLRLGCMYFTLSYEFFQLKLNKDNYKEERNKWDKRSRINTKTAGNIV
jgi:uncharacterized membrane protein YciS (DUF1049 family)